MNIEFNEQELELILALKFGRKVVFDCVTNCVAIFDSNNSEITLGQKPSLYLSVDESLEGVLQTWLEYGVITTETNPGLFNERLEKILPVLVKWDSEKHGEQPSVGAELSQQLGLA